jgi:kinesin family protein C1
MMGKNSSSSSHAIGESLLQAKIDNLEKQRAEFGVQLQEKEEENRKSMLLVKRLERSVKEMEDTRTEMTVQLDIVKKEKESLVKQIGSMSMVSSNNEGMPPPPPGSDECYATQLAETLSKPPAYMSSDDPATEGIWHKMNEASKELRRMKEEVKSMAKERDEAVADCNIRLEAQQKENEAIQVKMESDRAIMIVLKNAAAESDALRENLQEAEKDSGNLGGILKDAMENLLKVEGELATARAEILSLGEENEKGKEQVQYLEDEIRNMIEREARAVEEAKQMAIQRAKDLENRSEDDVIAKFIENGGDSSLLQLIEDLRGKLSASEATRKKLHSQLQELRGNVRVLVRERPFLRGDGDNQESCLTANKDNTSISVAVPGKATNLYHFDHVFGQKTAQERVYSEVSELIQSALDGYRVCIFSYGQTGSGKTWTMSGERLGSNRGIIPRAVEQIIDQTMSMKEQGWNMTVKVSVLELYNEDLKDLLPEGSSGDIKNSKDKLKITNTQGRVGVSGLNSVDINTESTHLGMRQLENLLERAGKARTTVATGMNERSSRSHMIFMMELHGVHTDGTTVTRGGLRLVDLAGSERLDRAGTANDAARLKETVNINKSLSCLADVFINLGQKSQHIPYRNSKLTMLLQDCLSGEGKSLMIVNVSPTVASSGETVCSLRFADQVSQVELGKAQRQMYTTVPPKEETAGKNTGSSSSSSSSRARTTSNPSRLAPPAKTAAAAPVAVPIETTNSGSSGLENVSNESEMDTSTSSTSSTGRGTKRVSNGQTGASGGEKRTRMGPPSSGAGKGRWM